MQENPTPPSPLQEAKDERSLAYLTDSDPAITASLQSLMKNGQVSNCWGQPLENDGNNGEFTVKISMKLSIETFQTTAIFKTLKFRENDNEINSINKDLDLAFTF